MNYASLHGGEPRRFFVDVGFATGPARPLAQLESATYTTVKRGVSGTWRHPFEGSQWLCAVDDQGELVLPDYPGELLCIGRAIDVFDVTGTRYSFPVGAYFATFAEDRSPLVLAYESQAIWAVLGDAYVRNHGIMG